MDMPTLVRLAVRQDDDWLTRLAKLIPGEALTFYGAASGVVPREGDSWRQGALWICVAIGVLLVVWIRWNATVGGSRADRFMQALIPVVSFFVWLYSLPLGSAPKPIGVPPDHPWTGMFAVIVWVTLTTIFYRPKSPPSGM